MKLKVVVLLAAIAVALTVTMVFVSAVKARTRAQELEAIEQLHRQDVAATITGDPKALAELWAEDAVRLEPGPAEVGKKLIKQHDSEMLQKNGAMKILTYAPEIKDVKIVDGWAFEWGYFNSTYRDNPNAPIKSFRAKLLRVLEKQKDGSWKFARVMWNPAEEQ